MMYSINKLDSKTKQFNDDIKTNSRELHTILKTFDFNFFSEKQQDATEFLNLILEYINKYNNISNKCKYDYINSNIGYYYIILYNIKPVIKIDDKYIETGECFLGDSHIEKQSIIKLIHPENIKININNVLNNMFNVDKQKFIKYCENKNDEEYKVFQSFENILNFSKLLIIQTNIYKFEGIVKTKQYNSIKFEKIFNVKSYLLCDNKTDKIYNLIGIVIHSGESMNEGHYYSYCADITNRKIWYKCDDSDVNIINIDDIIGNEHEMKNAYLLFYELEDN